MRYIDKDKHKPQGDAITNEYLEKVCLMTDPLTNQKRYQNIDYSGSFSNGGFRARMLRLGMRSQDKYCCYCLRKIDNENFATLEHIIPQKSETTSPYDTYRELANQEVILTSRYMSLEDQSCPPYPHTVAWNNLVVSCDGCFPIGNKILLRCCNNARSSKVALPVYFLPDIEDRVDYMENGSMFAVDGDWRDDIQSTIDAARLNCQSLKEIRRLWFLFRNYSYKEILRWKDDKDARFRALSSVIDLSSLGDIQLLCKFSKAEYWEVFMKYHLFYKLFQGKE